MNSSHLSGWKEIAAYLGRGVRTVQRWTVHQGLPVHRVADDHHAVQATKEELDCWIANTPQLGLRFGWSSNGHGVKPQKTETATILVVDDHEPTLYAVTKMLQVAGYCVTGASAGRQALSMTKIPTVIILDVNLPDIRGFDLCRMFRRRVEAAGVPIVFLSSTFRNSSAKQLAEFVGANDFLHHPITQQQLLQRIQIIRAVTGGEMRSH